MQRLAATSDAAALERFPAGHEGNIALAEHLWAAALAWLRGRKHERAEKTLLRLL